MSYQTWHNYGYGLDVSQIPMPSVERLERLLSFSPVLYKHIKDSFDDFSAKNPTVEDYLESGWLCFPGLSGILSEVILEAEGIGLLACDDYNGTEYLLYPPTYPWSMDEKNRTITEAKLDTLFAKYVAVIFDGHITADYQSVENGG